METRAVEQQRSRLKKDREGSEKRRLEAKKLWLLKFGKNAVNFSHLHNSGSSVP